MDETQGKIVEGLTLLIKASLDETNQILQKSAEEIKIKGKSLHLPQLDVAGSGIDIIDSLPYFPEQEKLRLIKRYGDLFYNSRRKYEQIMQEVRGVNLIK